MQCRHPHSDPPFPAQSWPATPPTPPSAAVAQRLKLLAQPECPTRVRHIGFSYLYRRPTGPAVLTAALLAKWWLLFDQERRVSDVSASTFTVVKTKRTLTRSVTESDYPRIRGPGGSGLR